MLLVVLVALLSASVVSADSVTLDTRYGFGRDGHVFTYLDLYRTDGKKVLPEIAYIRFDDGYKELSIGGGADIYILESLTIQALAYYGQTSGNGRYFQPSLLAYGEKGKVSYGAFAIGYVPLNDDSAHQLIIWPAEVFYEIGDGWQVGLSADVLCDVDYHWHTRVGPAIQKETKLGLLQVRVVTSGAGADEAWLRWVISQ